jgi:hypothetical protein
LAYHVINAKKERPIRHLISADKQRLGYRQSWEWHGNLEKCAAAPELLDKMYMDKSYTGYGVDSGLSKDAHFGGISAEISI